AEMSPHQQDDRRAVEYDRAPEENASAGPAPVDLASSSFLPHVAPPAALPPGTGQGLPARAASARFTRTLVRHFAVAGTALESRPRRFATPVNMIGVTGRAKPSPRWTPPRLGCVLWRVGSGGRLSRRIG